MAIYGRLGRSRDKIKTFERAKKPLGVRQNCSRQAARVRVSLREA